jgi:hypothetical protein
MDGKDFEGQAIVVQASSKPNHNFKNKQKEKGETATT